MLTPLKHTRDESSPPQRVLFALCAEDGHIDDVPVMSVKDIRTYTECLRTTCRTFCLKYAIFKTKKPHTIKLAGWNSAYNIQSLTAKGGHFCLCIVWRELIDPKVIVLYYITLLMYSI